MTLKEIKIRNELTILVDDDDYDKAIQYEWALLGDKTYPQVITRIDGKYFSYKKLILGLGHPKRSLSINGNRLDLRKENIAVYDNMKDFTNALLKIRIDRAREFYVFNESISKSCQGRKTWGKKNSKFIGVRKAKSVREWTAVVKHKGKLYFCGSYEEEEAAALAYDQKAVELYGSDAKVNFPDMTYDELCDELKRLQQENEIIYQRNLSKRHQGRIFENVQKKSQYVGVSPYSDNRKKYWRATIFHRNKQYHLGSFETEKEAALAYNRKALELYGESARINIIE